MRDLRLLPGVRRVHAVPDVVTAVLARVLSIAATFGLSMIVARTLPPSEAGGFFILLALVIAGATVGRRGTDTYALRAAAGPGLSVAARANLGRACLLGGGAAGLIVSLVAPLAVAEQVPAAGGLGTRIALVAGVMGGALSVLSGAVLRGTRRVATGMLVEAGAIPLVTVGIIGALALTGRTSLTTSVAAYGAASTCVAVLGWFLARGQAAAGEATAADVSDPAARRSRLAMMVTAAMFYLLTWSPVLALGVAGQIEEAAYFAVAARVAAFINFVPAMQNSYISPQLARAHHRSSSPAITSISGHAARRALVVAIPLASACLVLPIHALSVFGDDYGPAALPLQILALGGVCVIALGPVNPVLMSCGFEHISSALNGGLLALTLAGLAIAVPAHGAVGAAGVSAGGLLVYASVASWVLHRRAFINTTASAANFVQA